MIYSYSEKKPKIDINTFVAPSADIIGDVTIGVNSSIWFDNAKDQYQKK